jgi:hypothetical protein
MQLNEDRPVTAPSKIERAMATPLSTSFNIEGMSCASCVRRVEKALKGVAGVMDATVNPKRLP